MDEHTPRHPAPAARIGRTSGQQVGVPEFAAGGALAAAASSDALLLGIGAL